MRERIIVFLKTHPKLINFIWNIARCVFALFVNSFKKQNTLVFCSFGGRGFNDSPKALYDEIRQRNEFKDWDLVWVFVHPEHFNIPRGRTIKIDSLSFLKILITSKVWISNSGMDRGIDLITNKVIRVETWHGTPLKRICGEEAQTGIVSNLVKRVGPRDNSTIRCAQSEYDREIFARIFHATKDSILLSDLPRNDELLTYSIERQRYIRNKLKIAPDKKVILYTPTYREYLINDNMQNYIAPPMNLVKWEQKLHEEYVLLIRAHYAISAALNIRENDFVKDVSSYSSLNDLYAISDLMISDYSSTFFDYAILDRPIFCFAYDKEEYEEKRGLYLDMDKELPCKICVNEDEVISEILNMNIENAKEATRNFHMKYAPHAGHASKIVVDAILSKLA